MKTPSATRNLLCPYCGHPQPPGPRCVQCGGLFDLLSRQATQAAMGPWFIRDHQAPFRPGCSFAVILKQIESGRIHAHTVLRGPTTHQFWAVARNVPGVAHRLGHCHECNKPAKPTDAACGHCQAVFPLPTHRNELGLLYTTDASAAAAQANVAQHQRPSHTPPPTVVQAPPSLATPSAPPSPDARVETASLNLPPSQDPPPAAPPGESGMLWADGHATSLALHNDEPQASAEQSADPGHARRRWLLPALVASNVAFVMLLLWVVKHLTA